ncbi:heavy-metal-associated domain-containing protein [Tabrizicola sp. BL-A-41-H6]|uniref:heavy-metal-associated domain-containing protein n=1 Tax=Tabrizicola sp. BL-A-41-H6 TaxID=3421107 RepID=UPI003D66CB91
MIELTLPNMTCGGCARGVTSAVKAVDPGAELAIDVGLRRIQVKTSVGSEQIVAVLTEAGFPPA